METVIADQKRRAGMLMHISSLPGKYGVGDLGDAATSFADFLVETGCLVWQILPLMPTSQAFAHSPYSSPSTFAGNVLFISPDKLSDWGLIERSELQQFSLPNSDKVDFTKASAVKKKILSLAHMNFRKDDAYKTRYKELSDEFWDFCVEEAHWLEDYVLFCVLKETAGDVAWSDWPRAYRVRDWSVIDPFKRDIEISRVLDLHRFEQFIFFKQLADFRDICRERNIELIGDLPIYVGYDSADVWGHQDLFELDSGGKPVSVAGVPPDYFSETGQRWGNPIYRWDNMKDNGYCWWRERFHHALRCADMVRIDHFRGFLSYWNIPVSEPTAVNGEWLPGPGDEFFHALHSSFCGEDGCMPFIAEDLGIITDDVRQAMEDFNLPGMKVLHFAFGENMPKNAYIPHMHDHNCIVYVGTHDNNTTAGWWNDDATSVEKKNFCKYIGAGKLDARGAADAMIRLALGSTANLAIITPQDVLYLDGEARVNTPSTVGGNWEWRLTGFDGLRERAGDIHDLAVLFGRYCDEETETIL